MNKNTKKILGTCVVGAAVTAACLIANHKRTKKQETFENFYPFECYFQHDSQPFAEREVLYELKNALEKNGIVTDFKCVDAVKANEDNLFPDDYTFTFRFTIQSNLSVEKIEELVDGVGDGCSIVTPNKGLDK